MNKKIISVALLLICMLTPCAFAATQKSVDAQITQSAVPLQFINEQTILGIIKDIEQLKMKADDKDDMQAQIEAVKNKALEDKNSWLQSITSHLTFIVAILTIMVAVVCFLFPRWLSNREGELKELIKKTNHTLQEAEETYGQIKNMKDDLDRMITEKEIKVDALYKLTDEEIEKINKVLESPMAPFNLYLQAAALKCMSKQNYEKAVWFWETRRDLLLEEKDKEENDNATAKCYFYWGYDLDTEGKYPEAANKYEKTVNTKKDSYQAWNNWGNTLHSIGIVLSDMPDKAEEAITNFKEAPD